MKELTNSKTKLNFGALEYRKNEIMSAVADNELLTGLGWKPQYSLKEGLMNTINNI